MDLLQRNLLPLDRVGGVVGPIAAERQPTPNNLPKIIPGQHRPHSHGSEEDDGDDLISALGHTPSDHAAQRRFPPQGIGWVR